MHEKATFFDYVQFKWMRRINTGTGIVKQPKLPAQHLICLFRPGDQTKLLFIKQMHQAQPPSFIVKN